ncbi:cytochrome P450 [Kitasatospora sp. NPDC057500]|uniref:cytochrome P450 family protein n=1 Tax=Kitasatospora sp. NPDC057500 TaxID=3346151 RepID=UPI0036BFF67F
MKQAPTLQELAPEGHDLAADPFPLYAQLRAKGPVHRIHVPESGDCWLVVTRDAARQALADPRLRNDITHSSSWRTDGGHAIGRNMLQSDPPQHTRLRRLVAGHFAPARVSALRPQIEAIADGLLAALPERGTVDLVHRYALPLPVAVICALLGVPEADRTPFHAWSNELVMPSSPEAAAAASAELASYLSDLTARADLLGGAAQGADSTLLGDLAAARRAAGGPGRQAGSLTREELLGMVFLLLVAGHETTVNLISATVHGLLAHPAQLALLRADPALLPGAVEESLRYYTPVHASAFRFAAESLDLAGTPVAAGDAVLVSLAAASRDPLPFPAPDRFDIRRQGPSHLGFGHGLHHCLGAPLARAETTVALRRLLGRHTEIDFAADPARLTWRTSTLLRGLAELPVRLG